MRCRRLLKAHEKQNKGSIGEHLPHMCKLFSGVRWNATQLQAIAYVFTAGTRPSKWLLRRRVVLSSPPPTNRLYENSIQSGDDGFGTSKTGRNIETTDCCSLKTFWHRVVILRSKLAWLLFVTTPRRSFERNMWWCRAATLQLPPSHFLGGLFFFFHPGPVAIFLTSMCRC